MRWLMGEAQFHLRKLRTAVETKRRYTIEYPNSLSHQHLHRSSFAATEVVQRIRVAADARIM